MIFRFMLFVFLLVSCTQKETQQRTHELAKPTTAPWSMGGERNCKIDFKMFHLDEKFCELNIASASLEQLNQLQALIYSDAFLQNPTITSSDYFLRMQWQVNAVLEKEHHPQHLQAFIDTITRECRNVDLRECRNFASLKVATNAYNVLLKYLNDDSNKDKLELIYLQAANIKNSTNDIRLMQTFARRRQDFTLQNSLRNQLIIDFQMNESQLSSAERGVIRLYIQAGRRNLKDVQSSAELAPYLTEERARLGEVLLEQRLEKLSRERPALLESLNLTTQFTKEQQEIFIILDLVYWKYIQDREELAVLGRLYPEEVIVQATKTYVQLVLALEINESDLAVKNVMNNLSSQTSQLLQKFTDDVDVVRVRWQVFKGSCQTLASWVQVPLRSEASRNAINNIVAGLDISIRSYSEVPHHFYLALYLAKTNYDSRSDLNGYNNATKTALTVFSQLISPKESDRSSLRYTNDSRFLNTYLVKNALTFLFRSKLLQTLGEDQAEFMRYFVKSIRNRYLEDREREINLVKTFFATSRRAQEYFTYCSAYIGPGSVERHLRLISLPDGVLLPTFDAKTFVAMDGFTSIDSVGGSSPDASLMPFNAVEFADLYEHVVTDVETVLSFYDMILRSLEETGQDSTYLRDERLKVTRYQTASKAQFRTWNRMGECMEKIFTEEKKIREFAFHEEKKYLARIYQDLMVLRQHPEKIDMVKNRYKDTLFLAEASKRHIHPLDRMTEENYIYSRFDFLVRMASYIQRYSTKFRYTIELPENLEKSDIYTYSLANQTPAFLSLSVTDTMTEDEFIQSALKLFWGTKTFTRWKNTDQTMLDIYSEYIKNQAGQLRTGTVKMSEFLEKFQIFCDYLKMKDYEREILQAGWEPQIYGLIKFLNLFLDYNVADQIVTRIYGNFDTPYKYVMEDILGKDFYVKYMKATPDASYTTGTGSGYDAMIMGRKGPRARAELLVESMKNLDKKLLLYPLREDIIVDEYTTIKNKIRDQEKLQNDFLQAMNSAELSDFRVDLNLNTSIDGPRLSPAIVRNYGAEVGNFHLRTQNCFRADKNCTAQFLENDLD